MLSGAAACTESRRPALKPMARDKWPQEKKNCKIIVESQHQDATNMKQQPPTNKLVVLAYNIKKCWFDWEQLGKTGIVFPCLPWKIGTWLGLFRNGWFTQYIMLQPLPEL